ncbi:MAG: hypothetical protein KME27_08555 [Lyngbya sp. HA4199-MV5]|jgi:hypothetical protein|nr:hypothetical protein [Lyngbya sp. HA4199-MV5]
MSTNMTIQNLDWSTILSKMQPPNEHSLPVYPGDLKTALLQHTQLSKHPKAEMVYQLASDIARLTTHCDPEIVYWFSRLLPLVEA